MPDLAAFGWNSFFAEAFRPFASKFTAGRVAVGHKHAYRLHTEEGELTARVSGRVRYQATEQKDFPAVGDWVVVRPLLAERKATIHAILPRKSAFSRKAAGTATTEQVVAANVDTVFLVAGLDEDYNLRRLERYLVTARRSGAEPVVVLSKSDLCPDLEARLLEVEGVAAGAPVHALSALRGEGLEALAPHLAPGRTVALLGSSGAGKSTLINRLLGEDRQPTQAVRPGDDRGRHTTTSRELILLPGGGLVIDTPGLRELQPWDAEDAVPEAFVDLEALAQDCGFRDCRHEAEPRCAVRRAVAEGVLKAGRLASYHKLTAELRYLERREDQWAELKEKKRVKAIMKAQRTGKPR